MEISQSIRIRNTTMGKNVPAAFALTKQLLPEICANRGQIVFVNSSVVNHPVPGTVTYAATKHALKGLADGLRQEVDAFGVRVISAFPRRTATPLQASLFELEGRPACAHQVASAGGRCGHGRPSSCPPPTAEVTDILIRPAIKS
jgi:short-subunit dehydrogenase